MALPASIQFGAFAPNLTEQGFGDHIPVDKLEHLQNDADAISRLSVRGLLTSAESRRARDRLTKNIVAAVAQST